MRGNDFVYTTMIVIPRGLGVRALIDNQIIDIHEVHTTSHNTVE